MQYYVMCLLLYFVHVYFEPNIKIIVYIISSISLSEAQHVQPKEDLKARMMPLND